MDVHVPRELIDYSQAQATTRAVRLGKLLVGKKIPAPKTCPKENWPPDYGQVLAWRQHKLNAFELHPELVEQAKKYYKTHPVEFINHWCDTYDPRNLAKNKPTKFPLIMFPKQEELVNFLLALLKAESGGLVEKSRDMGATWVCLSVSVWLWLFWEGAAVGWGSNKQEQVDKLGVPSSIFEKIRMLIRSLPKQFLPAGFDDDKHLFYLRCINPETGATIAGEIGDNIGRGGRTLIYFVDEAAHLTHPESTEASLSENTRIRVDISSVSGLGTIFYRKREAGKDWIPGEPAVTGQVNVLVMDWSDHPEKPQAWHDMRKKDFENTGLGHVFARETERDYAAAVEGIVIPADWVRAAIDAHKVLSFDDTGPSFAGQDIADSGVDRNAFVLRKGPIVKKASEWTERDTGATTRKAVGLCEDSLPVDLNYDAVGVGSGFKAESNRLKDVGQLPKGLTITPWFGSAKVLKPHDRVIILDNGKPDLESPKNKDFYQNLKAQAWWQARLRFERTFRAINDPSFTWEPGELVSLPSELPLLRKLQKELSQATISRSVMTMKLVIDKAPEGASSPNIADAFVMAYWPWHGPQAPSVALGGMIIVSGAGA